MAKAKKTVFFCQECGYESAKWMGQCPGCRAWNTFVEEPVLAKASVGTDQGRKMTVPVPLSEVAMEEDSRTETGIEELDRVLGGGIVGGSLTLVGGDPGIGKSTLLLQVCQKLAEKNRKVLYISGEESLRQIKMRARRIGTFSDSLTLLCETSLALIRQVMEKEKTEFAVIDSNLNKYDEEV